MEWVCGSIFIRAMGEDSAGLKPGQVIEGHCHHFDHTSIFFCGRWKVRKWRPGTEILLHDFERDGPFHILIEAQAKHEFTFLGPGIGHAWCVYSHRTPQGEVSVKETGWYEAYV